MLQPGIQETTNTTGVGDILLTQVIGYVRFSEGFTVGQSVSYVIEDTNNIEWGIGVVKAGNVLSRVIITSTLVSGVYNKVNPTAINLSGSAKVSCVQHTASVVLPFQPLDLTSLSAGLYNNLIPSNMIADADYGNMVITANRAYFYPVCLQSGARLTRLGIRVNTAAAGQVVAIGIFDKDLVTGGPGTTIAQVSGISVAVTGEVAASLSTPVTIPSGWYWAGIVSDGGPSLNGPTLQLPGPMGMLNNRAQRYFTRANNYAPFGDTAFANASGSVTNIQNTNVPMVIYR